MNTKQPAMEYKAKFLKANKCSVTTFERAYIRFMEKHMLEPDEQALRSFAEHWNITIHEGLGNAELEATLTVHIAAMQVLADSEFEAKHAIMKLMQDFNSKEEDS